MTYYEILNVNADDTADVIKRAYKVLAAKHHPDKGGDRAKFIGILEAYKVLSNPVKRAEYDLTGKYTESDEIAKTVLIEVFMGCMGNMHLETYDLKDMIRRQLESRRSDCNSANRNLRDQVQRIEKVLKRFTPHTHPLVDVLKANSEKLLSMVASNENNINIVNKALLLLDDFNYDTAPIETPALT